MLKNLSQFCISRAVGKGFVRLVDVMPKEVRTTGDEIIAMAARVSYGAGTRSRNEDEALIDYMWRHGHYSPFEMPTMLWHVNAPIFVARQWFRHRAGSYNEESARYSIVRDQMYEAPLRMQSLTNKQGSAESSDLVSQELHAEYEAMVESAKESYRHYLKLVEAGAAREQVRAFLPVGMYTQWYWKVDLRNFFNFVQQRVDPHAQAEIRAYAAEMFDMIQPVFPASVKAFTTHTLDAIKLSSNDIRAINDDTIGHFNSTRERKEYAAKLSRLPGLKSTRK